MDKYIKLMVMIFIFDFIVQVIFYTILIREGYMPDYSNCKTYDNLNCCVKFVKN